MSRVLVPLAQGCEELEAVTIMDLLVRAGIEVTSAGLDDQPVTASRGTRIIPDTTIDAVLDRTFDLVVLPGGMPGAAHLRDDPRVQQVIKKQAEQNRLVGAICAGPRALAAAGVLDNRDATSFPGALDSAGNDSIRIREDAVVIDGNVITSRGPGTAMDFALTLIELLEGKACRDEVEKQLVR